MTPQVPVVPYRVGDDPVVKCSGAALSGAIRATGPAGS